MLIEASQVLYSREINVHQDLLGDINLLLDGIKGYELRNVSPASHGVLRHKPSKHHALPRLFQNHTRI